jgi:hypothetical protein
MHRCPDPHWVRTKCAAMAECARRATSAARPVASGYGMSHGKVFSVSTQGAQRTLLTWLGGPTRS